MEDLIKTISERSGFSADQSKAALTVVLSVLKDKMPTSLGGQLEAILTGKQLDVASIIKELSADKFQDLKGSAEEKLDDLKDSFKKLF
ncbi:MAG TPA: hypothetical protein VNB90_01355 [Cytophagaceae bacterium]|nr:hypothetical protein [Cytophagaceae bacterium]